MIKTNFKVTYKGEHAFGYKLTNTENNKWYYGIHLGNPYDEEDSYITSSTNDELKRAISEGKVERDIVYFGTYVEAQIWEKETIEKTNAVKDSMSYNEMRGISTHTKLPDAEKMKEVAEDIIENNCFANIQVTDIKFEKDFVNGKGVLKPNSPLIDFKHFQVRLKELDNNHVRSLSDLVDNAVGDLKLLKQNLIVVVLKNRKVNGIKGDYIIGGNHTFKGIIESKHCITMPVLMIPESTHSEWSDEEIRDLGMFLNPRQQKVMETKLEDIAKRIVDKINAGFDLKSNVVKSFKNAFELTKSEKQSVTNTVKKMLDDEDFKKNKPVNWIDWTTKENKEKLDKYMEKLKTKNSLTKVYSSGKVTLGDDLIKVLNAYYGKTQKIQNVNIVLYHSSLKSKDRWKKEYQVGFDNFAKILSKIDVDAKIITLPTTKDELSATTLL